MNAIFRFGVKAGLLAALSAALFNQSIGLFAQENANSSIDDSAAPKIERTAGSQGADAANPSPTSAPSISEVQRLLQEKYRKNGREMPSMNIDDLPNTQPPSGPPNGGGGTGPLASPAAPSLKPAKPNFFERLFHVGKGKKAVPVAAQPAQPSSPQVSRPAVSANQQPRFASPQSAARPTAPTYRVPNVSSIPANKTPLQTPLREPAQLGIQTTPSAQASRPLLRPGSQRGSSQPLLDETGTQQDSESLELNQDEKARGANQPPQILPNQTANGPAESPFTGVKISPNESEQRITSRPNVMHGQRSAADGKSSANAAATEKTVVMTEPATLPVAEESNDKIEKPSTAGTRAALSRNDELGMKDDDDDDDDDDELLTLPVDKATKPPQKTTDQTKERPSTPTVTPTEEIDTPVKDKPLQSIEKPAKEIETRASKTENPVMAAETPARQAENPASGGIVTGLRGFCPVVLKNERKLIEARPHLRAEFRGRIYTFSSVDAKEAFEENPRIYVPAGDGNDVVRLSGDSARIEGSLEHAAWYRGRLYLFSTAQTRRVFVEAPSKYLVNE